MLQTLRAAAVASSLVISHVYLGHIKRDEDRKILAHVEAMEWEDAEPCVRSTLESYLYEVIEGSLGEANFACMYTGEILPVAKVTSAEYDRTHNRPAVEILEGIRDMGEAMGDRFNDQLIEFGRTMAYKIMAAGPIKNHLVAVLKFSVVPQLGAQPIRFVFTTVVDLEDRKETRLDERAGRVVIDDLSNMFKRGKVSRAALFPCLDDHGREMADLLVFSPSSSEGWFRALEMTPRYSPQHEGRSLVKMIAEQTAGADVPQYLFARMGLELRESVANGLSCGAVIHALERAIGHGIDQLGFKSKWEKAFGDLQYRPAYLSLFGTARDLEKPTQIKLAAGETKMTMCPMDLSHCRAVAVGERYFLVFEVPMPAKIAVGKDLDMRIKAVDVQRLVNWMHAECGPVMPNLDLSGPGGELAARLAEELPLETVVKLFREVVHGPREATATTETEAKGRAH